MSHPVDSYRSAAASARQATIEKFGADKWPVQPGTPEHEFWLNRIDTRLQQNLTR